MSSLEEPTPGPATRRATALVAVALAVAGWFVAPSAWPEGPGTIEVAWRGEVVVREDVRIGAGAPLVLRARVDGADLGVELPGGVRTDALNRATVRVERDGRATRPALDDVTLRLVLADGSRELVPVLKWDAQREVLTAARRPPVRTGVVIALLGFVVVLWVTAAVPLFVTSLMIPVVLVATKVAPAADALAPFFHPIIALFFGGFLMAEAMRRVRLDHRAAITLVAWAGRNPAALFAAMLAVSAFLSMWMSNTAATAVLVPIAIAVTAPLADVGYRKALVLGIAYAATTGGVGSAIGTPANPLAIEFLGTFADRPIAFVTWFAYGLPLVALLLPVIGVVLWKRSRARVDPARFAEARRAAAAELADAGRLTRDQVVVLCVFALVMALWLTQTFHKLDTGIIAVGGAVLLALLGKVQPEDLGRISWSSLLTFGGGLTLGVYLGESGASDWLATRMTGLASLPSFLGVAVVGLVALGLTAVASNTASAAILVPLAIPLAGVLGVDPVLLVMVVALASSIDYALVIGTPPTMIAYSTQLFTTREIFRTGIVLDVLGIVLLVTAVAGFWHLVGLVA
jgi:sodium-dependent dicarboxylate transporter 2/3/5